MTKTIKLSLAAVMAAGIATSASAANLEDAIKGVDVSGYVDYRKETVSKTNTALTDVNEYAVNVTLTSKVNDMVKATVSAGFDEALTDNSGIGAGTKDSNGVAVSQKDADPSMNVSNAYFTFDLGATTVMAGKQAIPSVFVDQVDSARTGAGLVVLHKVSDALTVAAAHFTNNSIIANSKTTELLAIAKVGMVNVEAHYNKTDLGINNPKPEATRTFLKLSGDVAGVKVFGQTATADADLATKKANVTILGAAAKVGSIALDAKYFTAKDNNTTLGSVAIDSNDNDAQANAKVWQASTTGAIDMAGIALTAGMKLADNVEAKLVYATASDDIAAGKTKDYTEIMPMITYKMSKNFSLHARYSMLTTEETGKTDVDSDKSRIQVRYTF